MNARSLALALSLLAAPLLAQAGTASGAQPTAQAEPVQLKQELLHGQVMQADGTPWAGARLHAWGQLHEGSDIGERPLRRVAESDARGRFRMRVPRGHHWALWAVLVDGEGRLRRTTAVAARSGDVGIELKESKKPSTEHYRIQLPREVGGMAVASARVQVAGLTFGLEFDESFVVEMREMPGLVWSISLHDAQGDLLGENSVSGPAEVGTMVGGEWVDPFDSVPLLVLVKDGDKPVAGARFYDLMTGNKPLQAISDERGRALLRVRLQGKPGNRSVNTYVRYRFQAEGYAEGTVTAQLARRLAAPKKQAAEAGAKKGPKKKGVAAKKGPAAKKAEGAKEAPGPIALELPEVEEIEEEAEEEEPEPEPVPVPQDPAPPVKPVKPVKKAPPAKKDVKKAAKQDPKKAKEAAKAAAKKAQGRAGAVIPLGNPAAGQIVQILGLGANNAQGKNGPIQLSEDRDPEELLASGNPDIVIEAKPALRLRGQLLLGEGIPAAHVPIVLDSRLQRVAQNLRINVSWGSNNNERVFRTDAEGRFEIPCIRPGADVSLRALLRAEQLAVLSNTRRAALSPAVWFYVAQAPDKAQTQDLGELRLDQLSCLSIRSRHQSGVPARGAKLIFSAASSLSTDINHHRSDYVLNRRGQIALLYPAGSKFAVAVATDGGFIERKLESPKEAAASQDIDLQMTEPIWITGIIRNNAGKPIPGARVQASQLGGRTAQMLLRNLMNRSVETDSAGRFRLPALPESRYYLFAHYSGPTRNQKKGQRRVANMQRPVVLTVEESAPELVELTMDVELPEKEAGKKQ